MTGTPVRNLATDTFALFGDATDPGRVLHRYSVSRSLLDEATVPVMLDPRPVVFEMDDEALQAEFDQFADDFDLDDPDRETLSRKFGRLTSVFANPDRVRAVCRNIVDHYLAGAYRNGLKAQVVAFSRELAVTYTDTINELLAGDEASRVLAEVGRHERITAEVNISVSDAKDEDPAMRPYRMTETQEEEQKRRFLTPDDPLCFLVVTAKLMTGFDAPNEGVLYLDKPMKAHTLFQAITRPNRTWISPAGYVKTTGVVVDYIGLAEEVQRAVTDPTAGEEGRGARAAGSSPTCPTWSPSSAPPSPASRTSSRMSTTWTSRSTGTSPCEPLTPSSTPTPPPPRRSPGTTGCWPGCTRTSTPTSAHRQVPRRLRAVRIRVHDPVQEVLRRGSKERLGELGPMVLEIINAHVHSFTAVASQEEPLVLDAQGIASSRSCWPSSGPRPTRTTRGARHRRPRRRSWTHIKAALDKGVEPGSAKYTALAERIRQLRNRIIQNAQDALDFLSEALRVARTIVDAEKHPDEAVVMLTKTT